ncbi:hypothetical protein GCM10009765_23110 [Fodinicola feengrottensis]|uniref:NlpC/P60 domain-containing protein n=1 Tax=Fodinicola feengrottensis TaxID=435914 RepID=A0ABN2GLE9_9ACTN
MAFALAQRGKPYVFGASGTDLYDCPSLVQESYRYTGISLPRTVRPQRRITRSGQVNALLPGDLLFFATDRNNWDTIHHVGIYLGNGKMIHTPQSGDVVPIAPVWWAEFFAATRVVGAAPPGQSENHPQLPGQRRNPVTRHANRATQSETADEQSVRDQTAGDQPTRDHDSGCAIDAGNAQAYLLPTRYPRLHRQTLDSWSAPAASLRS